MDPNDKNNVDELDMGRICPVYALAPMRVFGLSSGSAMLALLVFVVFNSTVGVIAAILIAFAIAYIGEKVSAGRESGFAVQWIAGNAKGKFAMVIAKSWGEVGLMPPPNHQNTYEP